MKFKSLRRAVSILSTAAVIVSSLCIQVPSSAEVGDTATIIDEDLMSGAVNDPEDGSYVWGTDIDTHLTDKGLLLTNLNSSDNNYKDEQLVIFAESHGDKNHKLNISYNVAYQEKSKGQEYTDFTISYYNESDQFMFGITESIGEWADKSYIVYADGETTTVSSELVSHIGGQIDAEVAFDDNESYVTIDGNTYKIFSDSGIKYATISVDGEQDYNRGIYITNYKIISTEVEYASYSTVTYNVNGNISTDTILSGQCVNENKIPDTEYAGFIFKGWAVNGDESNIITNDDLKTFIVDSDMTLTAVYEVDTSYIEKIVDVSISGPSSMAFGNDPDTAAVNRYTVTLMGEKGNIITSDTIDERVDDFKIEWDIDGFRTVNDIEGQYCDSYGEFAAHEDNATTVDFMLKQVDMNFYGVLKAHITYNGDEFDASMYVSAIGSKGIPSTQVLPDAGFPSDFDVYPDSLINYNITKATYGGGYDIMVGGWSMSGSDSGNAVILKEDNNKFVRVECPNSKKSHMFTHTIDTPKSQIIFEQDMRFGAAGACITLTSKYPFYSSEYTNPVTFMFTGSTVTLNDVALTFNERECSVNTGEWYRVVLSVDKTTESCFAKIYDKDGTIIGETENIAWKEPSSPTFYSIGYSNNDTGTVDFDNYTAYYPSVDNSTYSLTASQKTLSIPNKDTSVLTASVKTADGFDITGEASWSVIEDDMREGVVITPDETDSHKAVISLGEYASAGEVTIQVSINGYTKTIVLNITDSAESIKFTESKSSISIPLNDSDIEKVKYSAILINGEGIDQKKDIDLEIYDKNNSNKYTLPEGITFDSESGILEVASNSVPCSFTIRATGLNSDNELISKSLKITVHGLSFDFGSGSEESLVEGYTEVTPDTAYSESRGYGIEGSAIYGGNVSDSDENADYLEGTFTFKANVEPGNLYKVKVNFSGDLVSERVNDYLTGHERTLETEGSSHTGYTIKTEEISEQIYEVPVVDDVLDLTFTNAKVSAIEIERVERTPSDKPSIYSIGDSTLGNNGSYGYTLVRSLDKYPELTAIADYHNNGKGSRNLQTYYTQGWLDSVLSSIKPGDIVTIGNMGTNPGGLSGSQFKEPLDYYVDACLAMGAKVILTSYTPHGCVSGYEYVYDAQTHTFHGCRQDAYDSLGIRLIYEERITDDRILGFIDIGKMADDAFNAYTADYAKNGYDSADDAAQAIISCFADHNHYNKGTLACELMLNGYEGAADGIVKSLVDILSGNYKKDIKTIYDENGILITAEYEGDVLKSIKSIEEIHEGDQVIENNEENTKVFAWSSLEEMKPIKTKEIANKG